MKYLGMTLDGNSSLDEHNKFSTSDATKKLKALRKINDCITRPTDLTLYKS